jgi:hypothetical protein
MTSAALDLSGDIQDSIDEIERVGAVADGLRQDADNGKTVDKKDVDAVGSDAKAAASEAQRVSGLLVAAIDKKEIEDAASAADVVRLRQAHALDLAHRGGVSKLRGALLALKAKLDLLQKAVNDVDLPNAIAEVGQADKPLESAEQQAKQKFDASVKAVSDLAPFLAITGGVGPLGTLSTRSERIRPAATPEQAFWSGIRASQLTFQHFDDFMKEVCDAGTKGVPVHPADDCGPLPRTRVSRALSLQLPFPGVDQYRQLRVAAEVFLLTSCGVILPKEVDGSERERLGVPETFGIGELKQRFQEFKARSDLQYLELLADRLGQPRRAQDVNDPKLYACINEVATMKLQCPCLIELIWSYWLEEGMQVQAINAIGLRFQNRRIPGRDGLARLHVDPLRPLNSLLWGYIQDEQHRLTIARRAYEYDHHYGITLAGKAVPVLSSADSRSKFLEAFHNLLHLTAKFYTQVDNTQIIADGFPVLNALREVHQLLTDGGDNQWGDLPWTARLEMLVQQWILARPEMDALFPGRTTTLYDERWMRTVDAVKTAQGWTDTSITHFYRLATFGELLLLSVRFFPWGFSGITSAQAANWALYWRNEVQGYVHAYRAATGVDLAAVVDVRSPSQLLLARLANTGS